MIITLFLLLTSATGVSYAKLNYSGYDVLKISPKTVDDLALLEDIANNSFARTVDPWSSVKGSYRSVLTQLNPTVVRKVKRRLKAAGISFTTAYHDLQRAIEKEQQGRTYSAAKLSSTGKRMNFDFSKYHRLEDINRYLRYVGNIHKRIAKVICIGKSFESRDILGLRVSVARRRRKPAVVLEHGIHAREWISPATALLFINELVTKAESDLKEVLEKYDFYIFPVINPDGYAYSHISDRMWRKSRSIAPPATCVGVDINRNFDIHHCKTAEKMRNYRCESVFCGDYPFSEPESAALRDFVFRRKDRIKLYISIHSYGQLWMIPYGHNFKFPPNYRQLRKLALIGIKELTAVHGTKYRFGTIRRILYAVSGDSADWVYSVANVSLVYSLELRDEETYGFLLPEDQIIPTAEETWAGILAVVKAM